MKRICIACNKPPTTANMDGCFDKYGICEGCYRQEKRAMARDAMVHDVIQEVIAKKGEVDPLLRAH